MRRRKQQWPGPRRRVRAPLAAVAASISAPIRCACVARWRTEPAATVGRQNITAAVYHSCRPSVGWVHLVGLSSGMGCIEHWRTRHTTSKLLLLLRPPAAVPCCCPLLPPAANCPAQVLVTSCVATRTSRTLWPHWRSQGGWCVCVGRGGVQCCAVSCCAVGCGMCREASRLCTLCALLPCGASFWTSGASISVHWVGFSWLARCYASLWSDCVGVFARAPPSLPPCCCPRVSLPRSLWPGV